MTRRTFIQTIPRVPDNLPGFLDALVTEIIRSPRLGAGQQNHFAERQPRQGLIAILEPVGKNLRFNVTIFIELIPLANSVEIYLEVGMMGKGFIHLMKGLTEKMLDQIIGREITDCVGRVLSLESENYSQPSSPGSDDLGMQLFQTNMLTPNTSANFLYCPACGLANPADARFCETCGTKLA